MMVEDDRPDRSPPRTTYARPVKPVTTSFPKSEVVRLQAAADRAGFTLAGLLRYLVRSHPESPLYELYGLSVDASKPAGDAHA